MHAAGARDLEGALQNTQVEKAASSEGLTHWKIRQVLLGRVDGLYIAPSPRRARGLWQRVSLVRVALYILSKLWPWAAYCASWRPAERARTRPYLFWLIPLFFSEHRGCGGEEASKSMTFFFFSRCRGTVGRQERERGIIYLDKVIARMRLLKWTPNGNP